MMSGAKKRRRRRNSRGGPGCFSVLLFIVLSIAAFSAVIAIFFRIKTIDVIGNERYRTDEIVTASGIERGDNLIFFNKFSAVSRIFSSLPYVEEVRTIRDVPDRLVIEVKETHAAAYIAQGEAYWLISAGGKLLERVRELPEGLIEIDGITLKSPEAGRQVETEGDDTTKADSIVAVMTALDGGDMLSTVSRISLGGVYDVSMIFLDRFTVELGMPEQLDYKLEFLLEVADGLGGDASGVIDLSALVEKGEGRFRPYSN